MPKKSDHGLRDQAMPLEHSNNCDWHTDQYPWECNCGAILMTPKQIMAAQRDTQTRHPEVNEHE